MCGDSYNYQLIDADSPLVAVGGGCVDWLVSLVLGVARTRRLATKAVTKFYFGSLVIIKSMNSI